MTVSGSAKTRLHALCDLRIASSDRNDSIFACRTVNRLNRGNVEQSFRPVWFRVMAAANAVGETIKFQSKLVDHRECLLKPLALNFAKQAALFLESKSRVQRGPTFFPVDLDERGGRRTEARGPVAYQDRRDG